VGIEAKGSRYNRPVKIYTRSGDAGETSLFDGTRVSKADPRVAAYGHVDELNAMLGMARAAGLDTWIDGCLDRIQIELFAVGAALADPRSRVSPRISRARLDADATTRLERWIDDAEASLAPLTRFVVPGGAPGGAALHLARTVCRRAEREVVTLARTERINPQVLIYLNRLSDLLFVLARVLNRNGQDDVLWVPGKTTGAESPA
jgi:cob(I)alamin adenosyltransferase